MMATDLVYQYGRYYNDPGDNQTAHYTTPPISGRALSLRAGGARNRPVTLRSLSWTCWWPDVVLRPDPTQPATSPDLGAVHNRNLDFIPSRDCNPNGKAHPFFPDIPDPVWENPKTELPAAAVDWDPVTVDIELPDGTAAFAGDPAYPNARQGGTGISYAPGSPLRRADGTRVQIAGDEGIRLRFFFNESQPANKPLQDTPALDDMTLTYFLNKPAIQRWQLVTES